MTDVTARMLRPRSFEMFADLTPGVAVTAFADSATATTVIFAGTLTAAQVEQVRARMGSRDDADQLARRNLAALKASASSADLSTPAGLAALRSYAVALGDYLLGEIP